MRTQPIAMETAINTRPIKIHITTKHNGKMGGMQSISTSCTTNARCRERAKVKGSICEKCYAARMMKMFTGMRPTFERNGKILSERVLGSDELPIINAAYFRFESFGDLINANHLRNFYGICKKNPDVHFALWTKNYDIVREVGKAEKPKNIQIIVSSPMLNSEMDITKMDLADKVFTVYDKQFVKENKININCGAKNCLKCHKCYKKSNVKQIREVLK